MLNSSVAILCRGSSLENIDLLPDVEEYVIVNGFADELKIEKVKNKIKDKPISHVMSLSVMSHPHRWNNSAAGSQFDAMIRDKFYQNFDVKMKSSTISAFLEKLNILGFSSSSTYNGLK